MTISINTSYTSTLYGHFDTVLESKFLPAGHEVCNFGICRWFPGQHNYTYQFNFFLGDMQTEIRCSEDLFLWKIVTFLAFSTASRALMKLTVYVRSFKFILPQRCITLHVHVHI